MWGTLLLVVSALLFLGLLAFGLAWHGGDFHEARDGTVTVLTRDALDTPGSGSGFLVAVEEGRAVVVTCAHVVADKAALEVVVTNVNGSDENRQLAASLVGLDRAADVAVLETEGFEFDGHQWTLDWAPGLARAGDAVAVIGNPSGADFASVSRGIVRDPKFVPVAGSGAVESVFVDAPTLPGNSGSPILDRRLRVLGMLAWGWLATDADDTDAQASFGGGPSAVMLAPIVAGIRERRGDYEKGFLGVTDCDLCVGHALTDLRARFPTWAGPGPRGFLVRAVTAPASAADLRVDDVLLAVDGVALGTFHDEFSPTRATWCRAPGTVVALTVLRPGEAAERTLSVALGAYPAALDVSGSLAF